jgi:hypothetical protein
VPSRLKIGPPATQLSEMGVIRQLDRELPKFRFPRGLNIILWNVNSRATLPAQSSEYESVRAGFPKKEGLYTTFADSAPSTMRKSRSAPEPSACSAL